MFGVVTGTFKLIRFLQTAARLKALDLKRLKTRFLSRLQKYFQQMSQENVVKLHCVNTQVLWSKLYFCVLWSFQ